MGRGFSSKSDGSSASHQLPAARSAAVLAQRPRLMGATVGFAPAPICAISIKAYANFLVAVFLLLGAKPVLACCCPAWCGPAPRNAYTGEMVETGAYAQPDEQPTLSDSASELRRPALAPGDKFAFEDGVQGTVLEVYLVLEDGVLSSRVVIQVATEERRLFSRSSVLQLKRCTFTPSLTSHFLRDYELKSLAVAFQLAGIASSAYAFIRLWQAVPVKPWADWALLCLLVTRHTGTITVVGVMAQTIVIAANTRDGSTACVGWLLLAGGCIVAMPVSSIGASGIAAYVLPGLVLGLLPFMIVALLLQTLGSEALISAGRSIVFSGKTTDQVRHEYDAQTALGKAWTLVVFRAMPQPAFVWNLCLPPSPSGTAKLDPSKHCPGHAICEAHVVAIPRIPPAIKHFDVGCGGE